jgi:hypothetical protein
VLSRDRTSQSKVLPSLCPYRNLCAVSKGTRYLAPVCPQIIIQCREDQPLYIFSMTVKATLTSAKTGKAPGLHSCSHVYLTFRTFTSIARACYDVHTVPLPPSAWWSPSSPLWFLSLPAPCARHRLRCLPPSIVYVAAAAHCFLAHSGSLILDTNHPLFSRLLLHRSSVSGFGIGLADHTKHTMDILPWLWVIPLFVGRRRYVAWHCYSSFPGGSLSSSLPFLFFAGRSSPLIRLAARLAPVRPRFSRFYWVLVVPYWVVSRWCWLAFCPSTLLEAAGSQ